MTCRYYRNQQHRDATKDGKKKGLKLKHKWLMIQSGFANVSDSKVYIYFNFHICVPANKSLETTSKCKCINYVELY